MVPLCLYHSLPTFNLTQLSTPPLFPSSQFYYVVRLGSYRLASCSYLAAESALLGREMVWDVRRLEYFSLFCIHRFFYYAKIIDQILRSIQHHFKKLIKKCYKYKLLKLLAFCFNISIFHCSLFIIAMLK